MKISKKTGGGILATVGGAVTAVFAGIILWGRVRDVNVPQPASWDHVPVLCASGPGVDRPALAEAIEAWRKEGHVITQSCNGATDITLIVDPLLDNSGAGPIGGAGGDVDHVNTDAGTNTLWGSTRVQAAGDRILHADIVLHPDSTGLAYAHEIGHALGYLHPIAPPTGCLMHPSKVGWDMRGLKK